MAIQKEDAPRVERGASDRQRRLTSAGLPNFDSLRALDGQDHDPDRPYGGRTEARHEPQLPTPPVELVDRVRVALVHDLAPELEIRVVAECLARLPSHLGVQELPQLPTLDGGLVELDPQVVGELDLILGGRLVLARLSDQETQLAERDVTPELDAQVPRELLLFVGDRVVHVHLQLLSEGLMSDGCQTIQLYNLYTNQSIKTPLKKGRFYYL